MSDLLSAASRAGPEVPRLSARRAATRERLMAAAGTVFAERGIIGASVEEICEAAGFTRGAFYSNFGDKDSLVLALIQHSTLQRYAAAEHAIELMKQLQGEHRTDDLISLALRAFVGSGEQQREAVLVQQELHLYAARQPALREPYLRFADEGLRQLTDLIADAFAFAGLQFSIDAGVALDLLAATYTHAEAQSLFTGRFDIAPLRALLRIVSQPAAGRCDASDPPASSG